MSFDPATLLQTCEQAMRDQTGAILPAGSALETLSRQGLPQRFGSHLLHLACSLGLPDCVAWLLQQGVDPNARHIDPASNAPAKGAFSPLMSACAGGCPACVELVANRLGPHQIERALAQTDHEGLTPFHLACARGHQALDLLLSLAPRMACSPDRLGNTPLILAARASSLPCLEALARACPPQSLWLAQNRGGWSALGMAIAHRHLPSCQFIAGKLAELAISDKPAHRRICRDALSIACGQTHPLLYAARLGETAIAAALLPASLACLQTHAQRRELLLACS